MLSKCLTLFSFALLAVLVNAQMYNPCNGESLSACRLTSCASNSLQMGYCENPTCWSADGTVQSGACPNLAGLAYGGAIILQGSCSACGSQGVQNATAVCLQRNDLAIFSASYFACGFPSAWILPCTGPVCTSPPTPFTTLAAITKNLSATVAPTPQLAPLVPGQLSCDSTTAGGDDNWFCGVVTPSAQYGPISIGIDIIQSITVLAGSYWSQSSYIPVNVNIQCAFIGSSTITTSHVANVYFSQTLLTSFVIAGTWVKYYNIPFTTSVSNSLIYIQFTNDNVVQSYTIYQTSIVCYPNALVP
jgi:hypothetical protein